MTERIFAIAHYADQTVLYLLILLLIVSIYLIFERFSVLSVKARSSKRTQKKIEVALLTRNYSIVEDIAKEVGDITKDSVAGKKSSSSEVVLAQLALDHLKAHGGKGLEEIFSTWIQIEKQKMERSLGFLATVGSNAPYIGLFGTVLGIMKSFNDLAHSTQAGQNSVMAGISAALIATAAGLLVAIPAVLAYNYFQKQVKQILSNLESIKDLSVSYGKQKGWTDGL
ncbi:MAG TPA: MotA/TolQ/ExbB proton channel family protein [Pseudobdellovibrionaceae bacterium]|nr:MotA/TolQ/ExbB proton channel family protein [Pseudobdellovibrionaceae bacterium]